MRPENGRWPDGSPPPHRTIAYRGSGLAGPPLVLIHGFPLDGAMWRHQLGVLGAGARVVACDLPGFGRTPPPPASATMGMDDYAELVVSLADALGFRRFVLCGLSMGGYVALALARRHPERLLGLALIDTRAEADTPEAQKGRLADAERVLREGVALLVENHVKKLLGADTLAHRSDVIAAVEAMIRRSSWAGVAAALRGMAARPDVRADLAALAMPSLVVVGAQDVITPPAVARSLASGLPAAELVVVPGAGHLSPIEAPDAVNEALISLLRRCPPG